MPLGKKILQNLASLWISFIFLILLFVAILLIAVQLAPPTWLISLPLFLGAINLCAALFVHPRLREQTGLYIFHVALFILLLLLALSRLTYLKGWVEVAQGSSFEGVLAKQEQGLWHWDRLKKVIFINEGFTIHYTPNLKRQQTLNQVSWLDDEGQHHRLTIGDDRPLVRFGYRFYTSFNKGFAPVFIWTPREHGGQEVGVVHLPSFPLMENQSNTWNIPGSGYVVTVRLILAKGDFSPEKEFVFPTDLPIGPIEVELNGSKQMLLVGDSVQTALGVLTYGEMRSWMGYQVFYDWTRPWLLAACCTIIFGLALHYWQKFNRTSWLVLSVDSGGGNP
ncbi:MAG: cytochrome c biogenesis protein ResB [Magnetococcus sp. DMHC-6]